MRVATATLLAALASAGDTVVVSLSGTSPVCAPSASHPLAEHFTHIPDASPASACTPVPPDVASVSLEVPCALAQLSWSGSPRPTYVNLMNVLRRGADKGPSIRIGGNSADESVYLPSGPLPVNDSYRITDADLSSYACVRAWNGAIVLDINMRNATDPGLAVAHIEAVDRVIGWDFVDAVEIGNECDLFFENGIRPPSYGFTQYNAEFGMYAAALAKTPLPARMIQGATWCCGHFDDSLTSYISEWGASTLTSFSYHHYPLSLCSHKPVYPWQLLLDSSAYSFATSPVQLAGVAAANAANVTYRVGEGNSVSCGGATGVSDVFAATLWAVDTLFAISSVGIKRWNFHGGPEGAYAPVVYKDTSQDVPDVKPLFYGMWAFSNATGGYPFIYNASVTSSNKYIKAWAVRSTQPTPASPAGTWTVVIIHKDANATGAAQVTIQPDTALTQPAVLKAMAPQSGGINAGDGIEFAGLTFDATHDGNPVGTYSPISVPASPSGYQFTVQPASIAVLVLPIS